jgi:inorganic triphosphatase YgiF
MDYLAAQLGVLQALEPAVREDAPDAVHKSRVATRRARSALKTFRDLFDGSVAEHLRGELSWLAGPARWSRATPRSSSPGWSR